MAQRPMLRAEVGMRVRCANKASAECGVIHEGEGHWPKFSQKFQNPRARNSYDTEVVAKAY